MTDFERPLLFSITAKDCEWSYTKGSGAGGQKRNKTSSAVHCKHESSGAAGYSEDTRSQHKNKELAFKRMASSKEFKEWHTLEMARRNGDLDIMNRKVERQMCPVNIRVEGKNEGGKWETLAAQ